MTESLCTILTNFTKVVDVTCIQQTRPCSLEIKLSFDGEQYFIEEAWLDDTIDFYTIADKYGFLDKLLEEALEQLKKAKEEAIIDRAFVESFD